MNSRLYKTLTVTICIAMLFTSCNTQNNTSVTATPGISNDAPIIDENDEKIFEFSSAAEFWADETIVNGYDFYNDREDWIDTIESTYNISLVFHSLRADYNSLHSFSVNTQNYNFLKSKIEDSSISGLFRLGYVETVRKLSEDEMILPLDVYLKNNKTWDSMPEDWKNAYKINDEIYALPSAHGKRAYSRYVRQDWLENLNMEIPETISEFYEMLNAFTYGNPDLDNINNTSGALYMGLTGLEDIFAAFDVRTNHEGKFLPTWNPNTDIWEDSLLKPQLNDSIDFITQCKSIEILSEASPINNQNEFIRGFSGSFNSFLSAFAYAETEIVKSRPITPTPKIAIIPGFQNIIAENINGYYTEYFSPYVLTKNSSHPNSTINIYLDTFMADNKGLMLGSLGVEGTSYHMNDDVVFYNTFEYEDQQKLHIMPQLIYSSPLFQINRANPQFSMDSQPDYDLFRKRFDIMEKSDYCYEIPSSVINPEISSNMKQSLHLLETLSRRTVGSLTTGSMDYESAILSYRTEAKKLGIQEILDELNMLIGKESDQEY